MTKILSTVAPTSNGLLVKLTNWWTEPCVGCSRTMARTEDFDGACMAGLAAGAPPAGPQCLRSHVEEVRKAWNRRHWARENVGAAAQARKLWGNSLMKLSTFKLMSNPERFVVLRKWRDLANLAFSTRMLLELSVSTLKWIKGLICDELWVWFSRCLLSLLRLILSWCKQWVELSEWFLFSGDGWNVLVRHGRKGDVFEGFPQPHDKPPSPSLGVADFAQRNVVPATQYALTN